MSINNNYCKLNLDTAFNLLSHKYLMNTIANNFSNCKCIMNKKRFAIKINMCRNTF